LRELSDEFVNLVVTSPPYWGLRDYGVEGQIGLELDFRDYVRELVGVFHELRRVLRRDGSFYLNLGDTYSASGGAGGQYKKWHAKNRLEGFKKFGGHRDRVISPKCLLGIPWRVAIALIDDGWILRNDIVWHKPNAMPSSVKDRLTNTWEHLFHFVKSKKYYYNLDAIRVPRRTVSLERIKFVKNKEHFNGNQHRSDIRGKDQNSSQEFENVDKEDLNPKGKGPNDIEMDGVTFTRNVGKITEHEIDKARSQPSLRIKRWIYKANPLGCNPGDFWSITTKPFSGSKLLADYVGENGKPYKASPDCPIHGHLAIARSLRKEPCGEQPVPSLNRIVGNESHPVAKHTSELIAKSRHDTQDALPSTKDSQNQHNVQKQKHHDKPLNKTLLSLSHASSNVHDEKLSHTNHTPNQFVPQTDNSDYSLPAYTQTANEHNKENHRKPSQNEQHDNAYAKTPSHKLHTSQEPVDAEHRHDISENNISVESVANEKEKNPSGGNVDHSLNIETPCPKKCTCSVIKVDHFAVYPEELCVMPILSSSRPGDLVLDPFIGSGTTAVVAKKLGRSFLGCDINPEYVKMAIERILNMR